MDTVNVALSIAASLLSIYSVVTASSAKTKVAALEHRLTQSSVAGGQRIHGDSNTQVGGNVNGR